MYLLRKKVIDHVAEVVTAHLSFIQSKYAFIGDLHGFEILFKVNKQTLKWRTIQRKRVENTLRLVFFLPTFCQFMILATSGVFVAPVRIF